MHRAKSVSGERSAPNKQVLQSQLRRERITPGAIREKREGICLAYVWVRQGQGEGDCHLLPPVLGD